MSDPDSIDDITVSDVQLESSTGWDQMNEDRIERQLRKAKRCIRGQLSKRQSRFSSIEGDRVDATILLAAHFVELAQGGESQSDSTQGGSVSYNTVTGEWTSSLSETRYGRQLSDLYLRDRQGLSIVRTF